MRVGVRVFIVRTIILCSTFLWGLDVYYILRFQNDFYSLYVFVHTYIHTHTHTHIHTHTHTHTHTGMYTKTVYTRLIKYLLREFQMKFLNDSSIHPFHHTTSTSSRPPHHPHPSAFDKCENNVHLIDFSSFLPLVLSRFLVLSLFLFPL